MVSPIKIVYVYITRRERKKKIMERGILEYPPLMANLTFLMKYLSRIGQDPLKSYGQKKRSTVNSVVLFMHFVMIVTKRKQLRIHALPMGTAPLQYPGRMKSTGLTVSSRSQVRIRLVLWTHRPNPRLIFLQMHMRRNV